jgi:hypothetical protein
MKLLGLCKQVLANHKKKYETLSKLMPLWWRQSLSTEKLVKLNSARTKPDKPEIHKMLMCSSHVCSLLKLEIAVSIAIVAPDWVLDCLCFSDELLSMPFSTVIICAAASGTVAARH